MSKQSLCKCGCGKVVLPASHTNKKRGLVKGQSANYLKGHTHRSRDVGAIEFLPDLKTGCWIWQRSVMSQGYGNLRIRGKYVLAHRYLYELVRGKIPPTCELDHLCRNHQCVNPFHLEAVSHAENCYRGTRAKLSHEKVKLIKKLNEQGWTTENLALHLNVSESTILSALNGRSWTK